MCPDCGSTSLLESCTDGSDSETGYRDEASRYTCRDCGAKWDESEIDAYMAEEQS